MATATSEQTVKGGAWLIEETDPATVMTPEKITDEHRLIQQTATEFVDNEVVPVNDQLEKKDWSLARQLIRKCGELGLLGTNIPEEYGGVDLDKISARTERFSGADLRHLCEAAAQGAMEEAIRTGTARPISAKDFERAQRDILPSTLPWFDVARNYAQFANEGGRYDDLIAYMRRHKLG